MEPLSILPTDIRGTAFHHLENLHQKFDEENLKWVDATKITRDLSKVLACSDFVANQLHMHPDWLMQLAKDTKLYTPKKIPRFEALLRKQLKQVTDEETLLKQLRLFRNQQMLRIAWREITEVSRLLETMQTLSELAEVVVNQILEKIYSWLAEEYGFPVNHEGIAQKLLVIAMGKLGGRELNFSSDIDLIFSYPSDVQMRQQQHHKEITADMFFTKLGQRLINALSLITQEGFVFRVDMRLRPFGDSGPLVMSDVALESYYQEQGREWERYAFIKARIISGDLKPAAQLMTMLRPFVYRRYIDYGVFESLREMKGLIEREVRLHDKQDDIKSGKGGIRQIEFIGQAFQLVRGGREPIFQQRDILKVLKLLAQHRHLSKRISAKLTQAYIFLRDTEHRLQMMRDQQTHKLPIDPVDQARLAFGMKYESWAAFREQLDHHRNLVSNFFEVISAGPVGLDVGDEEQTLEDMKSVYALNIGREESLQLLKQAGFDDSETAYQLLEVFIEGVNKKKLSLRGQRRLDKLMPMVLFLASQAAAPLAAFKNLIRIIEAIGKRSAYLALMVENPEIIQRLIRLCAASPWITKQLCTSPVLLDEFLDPRRLYHPPTLKELSQEIEDRLRWIEPNDLEQIMDSLRQFKQANELRVTIADVMEEIPVKRVSDYLTNIAEVILAKAIDVVWFQMVEKYGYPQKAPGINSECEFAIVAYGKLGGIELGYASDLDLVFLHSGQTSQPTSGIRQITNEEFYIRFGQRIFNLLNTSTLSGDLYHVDMRLRPLGQSGLLVTSLAAFAEYQRNDAWTWEHQALVRSRVVAGHVKIKQQFESLRREILGRRRDPDKLAQDIAEMRKKIRGSHRKVNSKLFALKFDPGGIGDIEFIVQYLILRWTAEHPILAEYTDNLRQMDGLAATGVLSTEDADNLKKAYLVYRHSNHIISLQGGRSEVEEADFATHRQAVINIWQQFFNVTNQQQNVCQ